MNNKTIKVQKTREVKKVFKSFNGAINDTVRCVEGKLVLVPNNETGLLLEGKGRLYMDPAPVTPPGMPRFSPFIISETEDWFKGETCYFVKEGGIVKMDIDSDKLPKGKASKILAFPEHFTRKHLQAIVDGKIKKGDKVWVECDVWRKDDGTIMTHAEQLVERKSDNYPIKQPLTIRKVVDSDMEAFVKLIAGEDIEWVVNDLSELGVKIGSRFFFLYKGESLEYKDGEHDDGTKMKYRRVGKREFGECCHPLHLKVYPERYTEGEGWEGL